MEYRKELAKLTAKSYRYFKFQTWVCQNVFNEVSLIWFTFQAKILSRSGACVQGERQKYSPSSSPLSKGEELRGIRHSMSNGNLILDVNSISVSYLIYYDSLLQNTTDIVIICDSYFITKYDRSLSQNAWGFLLQNATVITNYDDFITKCDLYYQLRQYNRESCCNTQLV